LRLHAVVYLVSVPKMMFMSDTTRSRMHLCLLIDPIELSRLVRLNLLRLEPEGDLLLRALNTVRAVADVAADIDGIVTTDGTRGGGKRVGSAEDAAAGLASIAALPDHGDNGTAEHVGDKALEERLVGEVLVVLLEVLLGRRDHLQGDQLVATLLETLDDVANKAALNAIRLNSNESLLGGHDCGL